LRTPTYTHTHTHTHTTSVSENNVIKELCMYANTSWNLGYIKRQYFIFEFLLLRFFLVLS